MGVIGVARASIRDTPWVDGSWQIRRKNFHKLRVIDDTTMRARMQWPSRHRMALIRNCLNVQHCTIDNKQVSPSTGHYG